MNIALAFHDCHQRGGVERILVQCANFLAQRGHQVTVLASYFEPGCLQETIVQREVSAGRMPGAFRLHRYLVDVTFKLAEGRWDVVGSFGAVVPEGAVSWVQSVHAAWLEISAGNRRSAMARLKQKLNPFHPYILHRERDFFGKRRYRKLIALTPTVKADLQRFYDVPEKDIEILPNGYSPDEFTPARRDAERQAVRDSLKIGRDDRVILWTANEIDRKGLVPLIDALARIKEPDVKVLAVGRIDFDSVRPAIERLGLGDRVVYGGGTSDPGRFCAASDLFCLPTIYEAWGLVIVEAAAAGLPVVTSRIAGAAAALQENVNAQLLDNPVDADEIAAKLQRVLRELPKLNPQTISQSVQDYAWPAILTRYEAILSSCATAPSS